ncbi:MAG: protein translocase subunit SecD [Actinobacteria bacterium]|nr:protein translocase subunit SecD [Actinomycetota bacterium]
MPSIKRHVISISIVVVLTAGLLVGTYVAGLRPRLGLDLRGGLSVTLTAPEGTREDVLEKTVEILDRRVNALGVGESEISTEGASNILIQIPGSEDPQSLLELIGRTAQLQFRQVREVITEADPSAVTQTVSESDDPDQAVVLEDDEGTKFLLEPARLTGEAIRNARAMVDPATGGWVVSARFSREGSEAWENFTGELACLQIGDPQRQVAIVLDAKVESAPQVAEDVECERGISGGETIITGDFSQEEAQDLAVVLTTGALPVELEQSQVVIVSPTLGQDALAAGVIAGALGLGLVLIWVLIYYRSLGLQVWAGLALFGGAIYGLVVLSGELIGMNLTLAGVAGLIVSVGIATDSYIVFFERIKEEAHGGKTLRTAVDKGFRDAWRTLKAANFVTILAAITLYFLAVGPVRGFALALGMATLLDLAFTIALTWPVASLIARSQLLGHGPFIGMASALEGRSKPGLMRQLYRSEFSIDFVGRRRIWAIISGIIIFISLLAIIPGIRGLKFGIDFRGGTIYRVPMETDASVSEIREEVSDLVEGAPVVQILTDQRTDERQAQVQTEEMSSDQREELAAVLASVVGSEPIEVNIEAVGEKWGQQITVKSLRGLAIFLALMVIYLTMRLEFKMAGSALVALLHDLVITAGVYALVGFEVTPATVIATLTIMGYSLYDTVVVFDKIKENAGLPAYGRKGFGEIVNDSVNTIFMRSINTSITTLIPVGSLLFVGSVLLGADTLRDLALALFVGIAASTYSSVFVAAPLLSLWKQGESRYASIREKVVRSARTTKPDPEVEPLESDDEVPVLEEAGGRTDSTARQVRPGRRPQQRRVSRAKRKKRSR